MLSIEWNHQIFPLGPLILSSLVHKQYVLTVAIVDRDPHQYSVTNLFLVNVNWFCPVYVRTHPNVLWIHTRMEVPWQWLIEVSHMHTATKALLTTYIVTSTPCKQEGSSNKLTFPVLKLFFSISEVSYII